MAKFVGRLQQWDNTLPGRCYNSRLIAAPQNIHSHPMVDHTYIAITYIYLILVLCIPFTQSLSMNGPATNTPGPHRCERIHELWEYISELYTWEFERILELYNSIFESIERIFERITERIPGPAYVYPHQFAHLNRISLSNPSVTFAFFQLPVHLYMAIALRASNSHLFENGNEDTWSFGQIVAVGLTSLLLLQCLAGFLGMYIRPLIHLKYRYVMVPKTYCYIMLDILTQLARDQTISNH